MSRNEHAAAKRLIESLVIQHMPTTAAASGLCSEVDVSAWVAEMSARFPLEVRPENMGITPLLAWLKEQGVECGRNAGLALRKVWLMDAMRDWCVKNPGKAVMHADAV